MDCLFMPRCYATRFIQHALREKCSWARLACVFGYAAAGRVVMEWGQLRERTFVCIFAVQLPFRLDFTLLNGV